MPRGHQFYEPQVQDMQAAHAIRGFQVQIGGVYVLLDDVITSINQYAQSLENAEDAAVAFDLATWLGSGERQLPVAEPVAAQTPALLIEYTPDPLVDRVEIYPDDPLNPRPKWVARSCDANGRILFVTNGSFDQEYVIADAQARWPGANVHLLSEAGIDSIWEETDPGGIRSASSGRRRPSPNRLWGN